MNSRIKGFTLIELLVVMAIIGILAGTAIVNFGKNEDRDVRAEKDRLTSFIREVQNKALAGDKAGITLAAASEKKICGYGLSQQGTTIQAYYITAPSLDDDCSSILISKVYNISHKLDALSLSNGVKINGSFLDVFFLSPNGNVYYGGSDSASAFPITINLIKGSITPIPIKINQSGRIY